jgi:hypothetical protein
MLREIPGWKLKEWRYFLEKDPSAEYRADWNTAHIVQALMRDGKQLHTFRLKFGDNQTGAVQTQSLEHQERLINGWCETHNMILAAKEAKTK